MDTILQGIMLLLETFVLGSYLSLNLKFKEKPKRVELGGGVALILLIANIGLKQFQILYPNSGALPIKMFLMNGLFTLAMRPFTYDKAIRISLKVALYQLIQVVVEIGFIVGTTVLLGIDIGKLAHAHKSIYWVVGLVCTGLQYIVTRMVSRPRVLKKRFSWGYGSVIFISNICTILLFFGMIVIYEHWYSLKDILMILLGMCIALVILNVFHFYMYMTLEKQYQRENEYRLIRHASEGQFKYIMQNEKAIKVVRKVKHDLSNQMIGLNYLLEAQRIEDAKRYVQRISENLESAELRKVTGFPIIDAVLNQKLEVCKEKDIQLTTHVGEMKNFYMTSQDQCVILGNALDNAIEACESIGDLRLRQITVKLYCNKGYLVFHIINNHSGQVSLKTSKDKEWHGIGLKSIKEVVRSYGGEVHIQTDEKEFRLKVVVPLNVIEKQKGS